MKLKKKWKASVGAVLAAGVLTLSLAGCGGDGNDVNQVGQAAAAKMSPSEILSASKQAAQSNSEQDMQAKMKAILEFSGTESGASHKASLNLNADLIAHQSPIKIAMNMKMDMKMDGQSQSQDMDMYMIQEGDKVAMYMNVSGQWIKQVVDLDASTLEQLKQQQTGQFDANVFTDAFQADAEVLKNKGITKINGKNAVLLEGEMDSKYMEEALKSAGMDDILSQLNMTMSDLKTKSGIGVKAYYDPDTYMPIQMDIDMTDYCDELFKSMLSETLSSTNETVSIDKYTMTIQIVGYGNDVPDVVLPAAAASAQVVS